MSSSKTYLALTGGLGCVVVLLVLVARPAE